jgi:hypothetical protein
LIDVAIPSDKKVILKEADKKLKYKNLSIEDQRMWNMKCYVIPVIIGTTGIVRKSLQKTAILGTSHIIRKVLQAET